VVLNVLVKTGVEIGMNKGLFEALAGVWATKEEPFAF
jgi:hypothetical protein